jgi:hypothetical protein
MPPRTEMKAPWTGHAVVELAALSALSALACIVAAACADLLFVALFGAASTVAITDTIRRLRRDSRLTSPCRPLSDEAKRSRRLSSITRAPCRSVMGGVRPAFNCGAEGGDCNVVVLNARDMLDEAVAVGLRPYIDRCGRRNACAFSLFSLPPCLFAPFFLLFALHCRCIGVLHLEPIGACAGVSLTPWLVRVPPQSAHTLHLHF